MKNLLYIPVLLSTLVLFSCSKETSVRSESHNQPKSSSSGPSLLELYNPESEGLVLIQSNQSIQTSLDGDVHGHISASFDYDDPSGEKTTLTFGNLHINNHILQGDGDCNDKSQWDGR